ncbi:acyl carrier protein [Winslowiella iniecta]|uniref:Carrier domain-containing protein n=1 Tax=Winslowiella iniecta TaxID=1560201 RepID=A0A0L7TGG0_9GAMM|nr:acyl carrier protein [Winslowiella iniecta]KOC91610.1 hypothetical protein NG42_05065 [Winslowiella iniecta]KOC94439.1 hypothetical protein NG43_04440 [Winslowiella iniecta]
MVSIEGFSGDKDAEITMTRREHIKQIIARCSDLDSQLITDSSLLAMDLYIDSLMLTDIVYETEDAFNIAISESEMAIIEEVADFYQLVEKKLAGVDG